MNKAEPNTEKRYEYLIALRENGGRMTAADLGALMNKTMPAIWANFQLLHKEGLVARGKTKRGAYIISVTPEGYAWQKPKVPSADLPKYPCGHPIVPSTCFCLTCHNNNRWTEYTLGSKRYFMPVMSRQYA